MQALSRNLQKQKEPRLEEVREGLLALTEGRTLCWAVEGPHVIATPQHLVSGMMCVPRLIPDAVETEKFSEFPQGSCSWYMVELGFEASHLWNSSLLTYLT